MVEEKVIDQAGESSEEDESDEDSDVPQDDFTGEDAVVIGEEGSEEESDEDEAESEDEDLDDTLKEEDWEREDKAKKAGGDSAGEEDEENEEEGDDEDSGEEEEERDEEGNSGWADAMAKVLAMGRNSEKTVSVLSKAKKDNAKHKDEAGKLLEPLAVRKAKKRTLDSIGRSRPDPLNRNAERTLAKIATRGVVQLFNAVRDQQKDMKTQLKQAGGSFRKQEKVLKTINKTNFINMLSGKAMDDVSEPQEKRSRQEEQEEELEEQEQDKQSSWDILREDFMLGAKMKDWDKEEDE